MWGGGGDGASERDPKEKAEGVGALGAEDGQSVCDKPSWETCRREGGEQSPGEQKLEQREINSGVTPGNVWSLQGVGWKQCLGASGPF